MRRFGTEGRVYPEEYYVVPRHRGERGFHQPRQRWQVHCALRTAPDRQDDLFFDWHLRHSQKSIQPISRFNWIFK